jgi:putative transcriptional regulator
VWFQARPRHANIPPGYTGWGKGQLEEEIAQNGWLNCAATEDLIFDRCLDNKYDRALALMGINPAMLSMDVGHA